MYVENRTKIANFPTPVYLTPPMKGFPVEFGIGVRGPKCKDDGPTRWSKKFSDRFSCFDTIPAVISGSEVTQGHRKYYHSIDRVWFPISVL